MFGSHPKVYQRMFVDLQKIRNQEFCLIVKNPYKALKAFLITLHFLKKYPEEVDQTVLFGWSNCTIRDKKWWYLKAIQHLKEKKIFWLPEWEKNPEDTAFGNIPVFLVSMDGVHCATHEPQHGRWSKNPEYYSHKFKKAGTVFRNRCVSINGPFPASVNDTTIFKGGIRQKIPVGRRAIVDNGYKSKHPTMSKPNPLDLASV